MNRISNMSVFGRLWLLSGGALVNLGILGGISYWGTVRLTYHLDDIANAQLPAIHYMTTADMYHEGIWANSLHAVHVLESGQLDDLSGVEQEAEEGYAEIRKNLLAIDGLAIRKKTRDAIQPAVRRVDDYIESARKVVTAARTKDAVSARNGLNEVRSHFLELEVELEHLAELIKEDAENSRREGARQAQSSQWLTLSLVIIGLVVGLLFSWWIIREVQSTLHKAIRNLRIDSEAVDKTATILSSTSERLAVAATTQAGAVHQTAASLNEISAMLEATSEHSQRLERSSQESRRAAELGRNATEQMLETVSRIKLSNEEVITRVEDGHQKITEVAKVIAEIGDKTQVINEIAFQTKLLSFNASVEAARAGSQGAGFAVVAQEVGNLARMSSEAAKDISELLHTSLMRVETVIRESQSEVGEKVSEGRATLDMGAKVAQQCSVALEQIVQQSHGVGRLVSEMANALKEQNTGVAEITRAIASVDNVTRENSGLSQDLYGSADSMVRQSKSLSLIVGELELMVYGQSSVSIQSGGTLKSRILDQPNSNQNKRKNLDVANNEFGSDRKVS